MSGSMGTTEGTQAPLVIRKLTPGDSERLFLFYQSLSNETQAVFRGYQFTKERAEKLASESGGFTSNPQYVTVEASEQAGEAIVGLTWFWMWDRKVPWFGIMIADAYQNRKLGQKMLTYMIQVSKECHKGGILLTTAKTNVRAQALYIRNDFTIIGDDPNGEMLMMLNYLAES